MGSVVLEVLVVIGVAGAVFAVGYALGKRRGEDGYVRVRCIWVDQYGVTRGREEKMYGIPPPGSRLALYHSSETAKRELTHGSYVVSHADWQQDELSGTWMPKILARWGR